MKSDRPTPEWKKSISKKISSFILKGDYRSALPIARNAFRLFPNDVYCRFQYAKILGDWADELPKNRKKTLKFEAIQILKPLLLSLRNETKEVRFGICLNYYYQSENFIGMVRFGRRIAADGNRMGYYAVGIGSGHEAYRRYRSRSSRAKFWAKSSLLAWKHYGLRKEKYYFPHYIEAMAHAVLGHSKAGMQSLHEAARRSGRPITDWEFSDVRALLDEKSHPV